MFLLRRQMSGARPSSVSRAAAALFPVFAAAFLASAAEAAPAADATPGSASTLPATGIPAADASASLPVLPALSAEAAPDRRFRAQASEATATPSAPAASPGPWGVLSGDWQNADLLGDLGGLRPALGKYGISVQLSEEAETFGNLTGGVRQGFEVNGVTTAQVQLDTKPLFGLPGGIVSVSGFHIWGGALSPSNLMNLQTVSGLEAFASIRLWELWWQQNFGPRFDVKVGEQSLDNEFMMSQNAGYFLNSVMGWPMLPSANLTGGGPAYPLAGLGVRARGRPTDAVTIMAGVFNGSPIPLNSPNTPLSNPNGVSFPLNTGVLAIAELQYTVPAADSSGKTPADGPLPGTYKIGAWWDSEDFNSQQSDNMGVPLADPASDGVPAKKQGNYSIYAAADQMIWRAGDPNRSVSAFLRAEMTTLQDRNPIGFAINGGLTLHDPLPGRDNDVFGLGFGVARVSAGASNYDRQMQVFQPTVYTPVRGAETFLEATYQAQILPAWQVQPDVQYIVNPGAGLANPDAPNQTIKNELVIGLRTTITF
ncbi:OprB family porin [Roseiarcus fermentans]|uniref:OprB family porin n=2 Tax=Roseiarcus fermentans TaxID=1473586 RepID=A0A366ESN0_9HYPH|nr:OprB family porin [Roseiarcus fermentans]